MIETTPHRQSTPATLIRVLVVFDSVTFLLAALLHLGVQVPLGFGILVEPPILPAAIVEGLAGLIFAVAAYAVFIDRPWAWTATIVAYVFAAVGVLVGINALAGELAHRTTLNSVYHNLMLVLLVAGLLLLVIAQRTGHARPC